MRNTILKIPGGIRRGFYVYQPARQWLTRTLMIMLIGALSFSAGFVPWKGAAAQTGATVYLPVVLTAIPPSTPQIHIPYLEVANIFDYGSQNGAYNQMALFWFGKISRNENYNHVRVSYNAQRLFFEVTIYDRLLWYDKASPSAAEAANWDAVSIYLQVPDARASGSRLLRFDTQLTQWENRQAYQAIYELRNGVWNQLNNLPFDTTAIPRFGQMNDATNDKGWVADITIPFASLGMSSKPADLSEWKLGLQVHDQDSGTGQPARVQSWPDGFSSSNPKTYGSIFFGFPKASNPKPIDGRVTIREAAGTNVPDGNVGGWTNCGMTLDHWSEWGDMVYNQGEPSEKIVIQNQRDVSDHPCFSRYYITFPLGGVPAGKVIVSAKLTMHHFGNSSPGSARDSYIQVFRVKDGWTEETLSWNNSPQVFENYPGVWVKPLSSYPGVPGVPYTWDVTRALVDSLRGSSPGELRLALQSADWDMHSGKYFWTSETAAWSSKTPPSLVVEWANP